VHSSRSLLARLQQTLASLAIRVGIPLEGARRIGTSLGWLVAERSIRLGVGVLVSVLVARYLGPTRLGLLSFAMSFVFLFSELGTLSLDRIVVRELVATPERHGEILGSAFALKGLGGLTAAVLAIITIPFVRPAAPLVGNLVALVAAGALLRCFDVVDAWFQAHVEARGPALSRISGFAASATFRLALVAFGAPLLMFGATGIFEATACAAGLLIAYAMRGQSLRAWRVRRAMIGRLLRECWPLAAAGLIAVVYQRIDQVMLGLFVNDREVGVYSVAVMLSEVFFIVPMSLVASVFPSIVRTKSVSIVEYRERMARLYRLVALVGYLVAVIGTLLGPWFIRRLYGQQYSAAGAMFVVLVWGGIFGNIAVVRGAQLVADGLNRYYLLISAAGAVVNVGLNLLLLRRFGGMGAAVATAAAFWAVAHGSSLLAAPLRPVFPMIARAVIWPNPFFKSGRGAGSPGA
jgi:O-antigen/teichoic acid export membrane protein